MTETASDYIPGRSLFAEMTDLREQMAGLRAAMFELVDLQRDMHKKLDAVLNICPIPSDGESTTTSQVV